jgi:hypothetical protein
MAGNGPPPNPNARRRNARPGGGILRLPANGYQGAIPDFPLLPPARDPDGLIEAREGELWTQLWRTPQAVAWAAAGTSWVDTVAMYVRHFVRGEAGSLDHSKEARALADRLGLSPRAMRGLMWEIVPDELGERAEAKAAHPAGSSARSRAAELGISAVDGG